MDEKPPARGGKAPRMAADAQGPFPSRSLSRSSRCHATLAETLRVTWQQLPPLSLLPVPSSSGGSLSHHQKLIKPNEH